MPWVLIALSLVAWGGKDKDRGKAGPGGAADFASGKFVEIDLEAEEVELENMDGSEIQQATAECGDLIKLETAAIVGQLNEAQIRCLDGAIRVSERQTVKDAISRVLLNDAWAKGDEHRWEGIARRHLEQIGRSDPDMCYKFAFYLLDAGPDKMDEAIKWADMALENATSWEGELHVDRVFALKKIKTMAAQRKWQWLEAEYTRRPSETLLNDAQAARNQTKTLAREWLEFARQGSRDTATAMQLCQSAAGTEDFCTGALDEPGAPQ
ncbi:MAG: hypothetical protein ABMA64_13100 [Myxococcota bacterium]